MENIIRRIADIFDNSDPLIAIPYRGFANEVSFFLKGRVLENEGLFEGETDSKLRNLADMLKRFESDEVAGVRLSVNLNGTAHEVLTDEEGYFTLTGNWPARMEPGQNAWLKATIQFVECPPDYEMPTSPIESEVLYPSRDASFGIITDIDDTVLQTHVTSRFKLKMAYDTFFKDSHQRLPMEGIPDLLRALEKGGDELRQNPIFYVSDSPWNIYDLLAEFLSINKLPKGPILLRDYGGHLLRSKKEEKDIHKLVAFRQIMGMYPKLPFIMLGDTASKDADYYLRMAEEFDGQVLAIYIRQTRDTDNARRIAKLIEEHSHIEAVLIHESRQIWEHARQHNLVAD